MTGAVAPARPAPLTARSVLLSVLLGSHPPELPVRTLVRTAQLFGITEGTARVALSRLAAEGEVTTSRGDYRLSDRHLTRQKDQDRALRPPTLQWRGRWVLAVALTPPGGSSTPDRRFFEERRMAELRPGVWARPDNLRPDTRGPDDASAEPGGSVLWWTGRPDTGRPDPDTGRADPDTGRADPDTGRADPDTVAVSAAEVARRLWDLQGWATTAQTLLDHLSTSEMPAERLALAAAMVRHIRADPVLPPDLLPDDWPGGRLRQAYDAYRLELGSLIAAVATTPES